MWREMNVARNGGKECGARREPRTLRNYLLEHNAMAENEWHDIMNLYVK